jgi:hypothetical protein
MIGTIYDANLNAGKIHAHTAVLKLIPNPPCGKENRHG